MAAIHPSVEIASRYSDTDYSTLNAYAAIVRVESLIEDVGRMGVLIDAGDSRIDQWRPWFEFEVVSYYSVGLVTCLEWHARSRLADLFSFRPACIRPDDLKGQINDKVLAQMAARKVGIPQLLATMLNVGSSQRYLGVFQRVFEELNFEQTPYDILNEIILAEGRGDKFDLIQQICDYRHNLVHEIDMSIVGSWVQRNNLDLESARTQLALSLNVMRTIENYITDKAPKGFPNRLGRDGYPQDEIAELDEEINSLEDAVAHNLDNWRDGRDESKPSIQDWRKTQAASAASRKCESEFITAADFFHNRYVDFKTPLLLNLRRARVAYLHALLNHLSPAEEGNVF
jgi:hypothetical protein